MPLLPEPPRAPLRKGNDIPLRIATLFRSPGTVWLAALLLAGTAVRLAFGLHYGGWRDAPDQLAWQLLLDEARSSGVRLDQLLHLPHEGGTIPLSLIALLLAPLSVAMPSLSWMALLVDTASRAL